MQEDVGTLCMYGSLLVYDPLLVLHTTLSMYSTTSSLSVAYNLGAMSGVMLTTGHKWYHNSYVICS